mmetsp:Transcript_22812/g.52605  ORF Transcript_22812/g.52605 Transcript_22812/m.52605 type:complete len:94 (-) Transcript_22812:29-310(-)
MREKDQQLGAADSEARRLREDLRQVSEQLMGAEYAMASTERRAHEAVRAKEAQIIEFLRAVEAKAEERDQELEDTRHRLARTEAALAQLMAGQ